jgi:glutamine synthetase
MAGLEVELYITRLARPGIRLDETGAGQPGPAPEVELFQRGYQFLSDARLEGVGDTLEAIRDGLWALGLPPRSIEDEWGPGQIEFTYGPMEGLTAADAMVLFRSAVKAICQRRGLLAPFMCWPALPNFFPCGWHLHQSLVDESSGANAFVSDTDLLSTLGRQFVAGLLDSAPAMAVFGDPTVTRTHGLSPTRSRPTGSAGRPTTGAPFEGEARRWLRSARSQHGTSPRFLVHRREAPVARGGRAGGGRVGAARCGDDAASMFTLKRLVRR